MKRFLLTLCAVCATTLAWAETISYYFNPETWEPGSWGQEGDIGFSCETLSDGTLRIKRVLGFVRGPTNPCQGDDCCEADNSPYSGLYINLAKAFRQSSVIIGENLFKNTAIRSLSLPVGTVSIESGAFQDCTELSSVSIPSSVLSIEDDVFAGCSGLTEIVFRGTPPNATDTSFPTTNGYYVTCSTEWESVIEDGKWKNLTMQFDDRPIDVSLFSYFIENGEVTITGLHVNHPADIIVPSVIENCPVTSIGNSAFWSCSNLTSITIPEGVTSIGQSAFSYCRGLTSVTIPEGVTSIGKGAFQGCSSLISIDMPEDVMIIGDCAFSFCISLTSVAIPSGVTSIASATFSECFSLTSMEIPSSVISIGEGAFYACSSLTSVTIPEGVTSIGDQAFSGCSGLTSVTIPSSVTSIGGASFEDVAPISLTANALLGGMSGANLTAVVIPEGTTSIPNNAFRDCLGLTSVTIPEGVTSIGNEAFRGCSGLTSITIPEGVTSIGSYAFYGCSGLKEVHISDVATWCAIDFYDSYSNPLRYAKNLYLNGKLITNLFIPEGVTSIESYAFYGCTGLTLIVIPSSVTSIGDRAFYGCSGLTSVTILEGVTSIGDAAFADCSNLTSVTIPSSVTSIGSGAFAGCTGLTSVTIPEGITSIEHGLFQSCSGLTSIVIPSTVTSIEEYAFNACTSLTSVTIPEGVTSIESYAFYGCSGLTSVTIPSSVTSIGEMSFYGCSVLTSVMIPASVTSVGESAFMGVSSITFEGAPPVGVAQAFSPWHSGVTYPEEYADEWENAIAVRKCQVSINSTANVSVSAKMISAKVMEVSYTINSDLPTVKVRAVAFANGSRSFAKIVPVKSGTSVPDGSPVQTHTKHTFTWNVSEDWNTELSKVAIEILVQEGELLPRRRVGVPALNGWEKMTITTNTITSAQAFNALLWCVAEGDTALTISNGVVRASGTQIASGISVSQNANLLNYLYGKMGYQVLSGSRLAHVKSVTRLDLPSSGLNQVAYKIEEESTEE